MSFFVARAGFFAVVDAVVRRFAAVDVPVFTAAVLRLDVGAVVDALFVLRAVVFGATFSPRVSFGVSAAADAGAGAAGVCSMFKTSRTWLMSE